jgi:hypothetical protein
MHRRQSRSQLQSSFEGNKYKYLITYSLKQEPRTRYKQLTSWMIIYHLVAVCYPLHRHCGLLLLAQKQYSTVSSSVWPADLSSPLPHVTRLTVSYRVDTPTPTPVPTPYPSPVEKGEGLKGAACPGPGPGGGMCGIKPALKGSWPSYGL